MATYKDWELEQVEWNLIKKLASQSKVKLPGDEKNSAASIGFLYGIREYASEGVQASAFIENAVFSAITLEQKKLNKQKKWISPWSLDAALSDENGTGYDIVTARNVSTENEAIFETFLETLDTPARDIAWLFSQGNTYQEVCSLMHCSESELNTAIYKIREAYLA